MSKEQEVKLKECREELREQVAENEARLADEAAHWLAVLCIGAFCLLCILALEWLLLGDNQFYVALQAWLTRLGAFAVAIICLLGAIVAFERLTPQVYLELITHDPKSCAAVVIAFIMAVAWIITCTQ